MLHVLLMLRLRDLPYVMLEGLTLCGVWQTFPLLCLKNSPYVMLDKFAICFAWGMLPMWFLRDPLHAFLKDTPHTSLEKIRRTSGWRCIEIKSLIPFHGLVIEGMWTVITYLGLNNEWSMTNYVLALSSAKGRKRASRPKQVWAPAT